jgi:FtsH-binding integral membrane protein
MEPPRTTAPNARAMRVIHLALTLGLTLAGVVFYLVRRVQQLPPLVHSPAVGIALAVAAASALVVAVTVVRPRVPEQAPEQTRDSYWEVATVRMTVIVLWAAVEGAGLLGAVGYILTGATAPAIALALGIVTLATLGPGRFEQGDA